MPTPAGPEIVLDLSRLVSRILHATPTGVDRVEMAYARQLLHLVPDRVRFSALNFLGAYGHIPRAAVEQFLDRTDKIWSGQTVAPSGKIASYRSAADMLALMRPRQVAAAAGPRVLLQASPHHLHDEVQTARIIQREKASFVCVLYDLIPIEYPEYARPDGAATHLKRIGTMARLADGVIAISNSTRQSFLPHLAEAGRDIPVEVALLAVDVPTREAGDIAPGGPGYFVCLGTIEPRKNHLLLLHLWRQMVETAADPLLVPQLIVIGRRGWENENIIDMLDRCPALKAHVVERAGLSDEAVRQSVAGARALLMPSFAEGFGLPVAEAIAMGVAVICSDLPAHREAGGDVPEYLDPLDGPGWRQAINDYADIGSSAQLQQHTRRRDWNPVDWPSHFETVIEMVDRVGMAKR